jgi:glycosyltransferase involved in cell wall biosynthesis
MNKDPLISVVIPTYNSEKSISYCLNSVLSQTYNNLEVIIVDDCSTDNTVTLINRHPDPRVRCIVLEKNSGAQAARNKGIIEAKADWIAFQDSDDEWIPDKLEKQVAALANVHYDPWVIIYANVFLYDIVRGRKRIWHLPVIKGDNQYATLLQSPAPLFQTLLVSKIALEKINFLDENVPSFQEWDTSIRLAKYCKFIHIEEPLMIYHVGDHYAISGNHVRHVEGWHYIINKFENDIKELCGEEAWQKLIIQLLNRCLNFRLLDYYDRYRNKLSLSNKDLLQMLYLMLCRKYQIKADNILYRFTRKVFPSLKY